MSDEHVHVITDCRACGLNRMAEGKPRESHSVIPVEKGIREVPATYTFLAESSHELNNHKQDMIHRVFKQKKGKPFFNPMKSRIVNFTHGKDHNET
ncbi:MAG: hypothetical protein EBR82_18815 [Caulobacteraceae bacterium]|nr:hypothetical protein [Caulobacteraceae bacterium]